MIMKYTDYTYQPRPASDWEARSQSRGYDTYYKDGFLTFKPGAKNHIRILPPPGEFWSDGSRANHYAYDVHVHYNVGPDNASVVCNFRQFEKPCPLCEERARLEKRMGRDDPQVRALAPIRKSLVWVLDYAEPDKGPKLWGMPSVKIDQEISNRARDRRTGKMRNVDNPYEGHDIYFNKEGEKDRTQYTGVEVDPDATQIPDLEKNLTFILEHPLDAVVRHRTYQQVRALFEGCAREEIETKAEAPTPSPSPRPAPTPRAAEPQATAGDGAGAKAEPPVIANDPAPKTEAPVSGGAQRARDIADIIRQRQEGRGM
jgi:hypothetical protein